MADTPTPTPTPTPTSPHPCPICGKPALDRWRPFCSPRCADIDLGRWLGEAYRIPADGDEEPDDDDAPAP